MPIYFGNSTFPRPLCSTFSFPLCLDAMGGIESYPSGGVPSFSLRNVAIVEFRWPPALTNGPSCVKNKPFL